MTIRCLGRWRESLDLRGAVEQFHFQPVGEMLCLGVSTLSIKGEARVARPGEKSAGIHQKHLLPTSQLPASREHPTPFALPGCSEKPLGTGNGSSLHSTLWTAENSGGSCHTSIETGGFQWWATGTSWPEKLACPGSLKMSKARLYKVWSSLG